MASLAVLERQKAAIEKQIAAQRARSEKVVFNLSAKLQKVIDAIAAQQPG